MHVLGEGKWRTTVNVTAGRGFCARDIYYRNTIHVACHTSLQLQRDDDAVQQTFGFVKENKLQI
jgi:predicted HD phosphohydrolase